MLANRAQQQIAGLQTQLTSMQRSLSGGTAAAAGFGAAVEGFGTSLVKSGSRMQWAGRQLERNFTIPLGIAAAAGVKFALDNQKAFTQVAKVYGDGSQSATTLKNELNSLNKAFVALSERFGVNQAEVDKVAAGWAAAGATGVALARSTETTLKAMVLGDLDAVQATQALISIQAQYGLTSEGLAKTLNQLNAVENQTGVSMEGLIDGFQRAAGTARTAGIDTRHLAAMIAAMAPAAGSAAQAGNGLKTIISRLLSPTKDATKIMGLMGINTNDVGWQSKNATQRLELMANQFKGLSNTQKAVVSSTIATRFQINRFDVLMRELVSSTGFYRKALDATSTDQKSFKIATQELNQVLDSNPQKFKIIWTILQNAMADVVQPLIPLLLALANAVKEAATWFENLNPSLQKFLLLGALILALIGPIVRYIGAFQVLIGYLAKSLGMFTKVMTLFLTPFRFLATFAWGFVGAGLSAVGSGMTFVGTAAFRAIPVIFGFFRALGLAPILGIVTQGLVGLGVVTLQAFAYISGVFKAFAATGPVIMRGAGLAIEKAWEISLIAINRATLLFGAILEGTWALIMGASQLIVRTGMFGMSEIFALGSNAIAAVVHAGSVVINGAWLALIYVMETATAAGMTLLNGIWRAGIIAIQTTTAALGTFFTNFWPKLVAFMRIIGAALVTALTSPYTLAIVGVIALLYGFRNQLSQVWQNIVDLAIQAFNSLPAGVANAMTAVIRIVSEAAKAVYEWFSYLNPFAHHSPSLVENVTKGMKIVRDQYGTLKAVSAPLDAARAKLVAYKQEVIAQQQVVLNWRNAVNAANNALEVQKKKLDALKDAANKLSEQLSNAKTTLSDWASTPIQGMKAMNDAIFNNDQAQKALQLQMMKMEDVTGPLDKIQSKMAGINGEMELLRGRQSELRAAGAGSDILSGFDSQLNALQGQGSNIAQQANVLQNLQDQLDILSHKAAELDLEKSLKFDPLLKKIDDVANGMREMPFDVIIANVTKNRAVVDQLQVAYDNASAAVDRQQAVVDKAQLAHDRLQQRYNQENALLAQMQLNYRKLSADITNASAAMDKVAAKSGVKKKAGASSAAEDAFNAGAAGSFPDVGGTGKLGREGTSADQSALIDSFTKDIAKQSADMFGKFDLFAPVKDGWKKFVGWWDATVVPGFGALVHAIGEPFAGSTNPFSKLSGAAQAVAKIVGNVFRWIGDWAGKIWRLLGPEAKKTLQIVVDAFKGFWSDLQPVFKKLGPLFDSLGKTWRTLGPAIAIFMGLVLGAIKIIWSTFNGALKPILETIGHLIADALSIIIDLIKIFADLLSGNWSALWGDLLTLVKDTFTGIWHLIEGLGKTIWGVVKGFVEGVVNFFKWLWDELVGHSIIPDMIIAIVNWFKRFPGMVWDAIKNLGAMLIKWAGDALQGAWNKMSQVWASITGWLRKQPVNAVLALSAWINLMGNWAGNAWNNAWARMRSVWSTITGWLRGVPPGAISALASLGGLLVNLAQNAFNSFYGKTRSIIDSMLGWLKKVPGAAAAALGGIGNAVANAVKGAWNGAASFLNGKVIGNINKVTGVFGVKIPSLPTFARGGVVPGGYSRKDNTLAMVRSGEGILVPEAVAGIFGNEAGLMKANKFFGNRGKAAGSSSQTGIPHFDVGGVVGGALAGAGNVATNTASQVGDWIKDGAGNALDKILAPVGNALRGIMPNGFMEDYTVGIVNQWRKKAKAWGDEKDGTFMGDTTGAGFGSVGTGVARWAGVTKTALRILGQDLGLVPTVLRRMNQESGGNPNIVNKWDSNWPAHPSVGLMQVIRGTYQANVPAGYNNGPYKYGVSVNPLSNILASMMYALRRYGSLSNAYNRPGGYDNGGILGPGQTGVNNLRRPEVVLTPEQWSAVIGVNRSLAAMTTGGMKSTSMAGLAAANMRARNGGSPVGSVGGAIGSTAIHLHGDIILPNIDNKTDAQTFLQNLESIARGR